MQKEKLEHYINYMIKFIKNELGKGKAVIGISGGKDSTITAALLCKALGPENVIAVMMPNGEQSDIEDSIKVINFLNIPSENRRILNIETAYLATIKELGFNTNTVPQMIKTNLPARLRMANLYNVAALYQNSRVINTCNLSENYVGYSTKFGDHAGDLGILYDLTVKECLEIGDYLGLPYDLVHKKPSDGMCGKTDEDNLGFTYEELDNYILNNEKPTIDKLEKIEKLHRNNLHKLNPMPYPSRMLMELDYLSSVVDELIEEEML